MPLLRKFKDDEEQMLEQPLVTNLQRDKEFLQSILRDSEDDPGLEVLGVESKPCCNLGDNYMSSITRVMIRARSDTRRSFRRPVLLKRQPASVARREAFRCDPAFRNEAAAYDSVLPSLASFSGQRLPFPGCLHASSQLLVLQDLQPLGYAMADRLHGLDLDHATLALKALGRFHGTSLAMKHVDPAGFERTKSQIKELVFVPEAIPVFGASLENSLKMATKSLRVQGLGPGDMLIAEAVHKLQLLRGTTFQRMVALVAPKEPLSVICHGDFWINNMLFKYGDDGKVEDVMLIDLQVARYACLATDVLHFLYTSMEPGLTMSHFDELTAAYHESLSGTLKGLAPDAPEVTLKQVTDQIEERALYGLLISFLLLPVVTAEDNIVNLDTVKDENFLSEEFLDQAADSLTPGYRNRIRDLVLEFVDRGFI